MSLGERLKEATASAGLSIRQLHRRLVKVPGSSYPSIHRYLRDKAQPPASFVSRAAQVLGVLPGWLLTGEGPRTQLEADRHREAFETLPELLDVDRHHAPYVDRLEFLGHGVEAQSRRRALLRFARKLDDASMLTAEMYAVEERAALIAAAGTFLVEVERAYQHAIGTPVKGSGLPGHQPLVTAGLLLGTSSSGGWWLTWQDAILELFARRVIGLGERSGRWSDAHHPAGPDPDLVAYEALRARSRANSAQPKPKTAPRASAQKSRKRRG